MSEYVQTAQLLAEQDYDAWLFGEERENVTDWIEANAHEYIRGLAVGGDSYHATLRNMRKDCTGTLADDMDPDRVRSELEPEECYADV